LDGVPARHGKPGTPHPPLSPKIRALLAHGKLRIALQHRVRPAQPPTRINTLVPPKKCHPIHTSANAGAKIASHNFARLNGVGLLK
jgi:hypothetical protein